MRNNQPVTGKLYQFPADQTLISVTDLKGRITYCNDNFIMASGYQRHELLGQAHNLIRHPDMPSEAFRDMWKTIQGGLPWTGLVKNRRKNGDHYWVRANATPVSSGGSIVGYLSVRSSVTAEEIAAGEKLYQTMRGEAGQARLRWALNKGKLQDQSALGRIGRLTRLGSAGRMSILVATPPLLLGLGYSLSLPTPALGLIGAAAWAGACALTWRLLAAPLKRMVHTANLLAAGDLTQQVSVDMEGHWAHLQLALSQLSVNVRTVVRDTRHEVANVRGATQEIAAGNMDMSSRTEHQASSLEQTAASLEEITGTVRQTAQRAIEGVALAHEAAQTSESSQKVVTEVGHTMQSIAEASRRIGDILQIIEEIAFQTNILALNAAVEAARAGEQGRGFAVVASEVRALSQRTSQAAREVRDLIVTSQNRVEAGTQIAVEAQERMAASLSAVAKVSSLLQEIQTACHEQELGITQIHQAVSDLDGITQQNAAMVEELAATAQSLDRQVAHVHNTIRVFKLTAKDKTLAEEDAVALRRQMNGGDEEDAPADIDFDRVLEAHQQWRIKLRNAALRSLQMDVELARRDDCCELGQWVYGAGGARWGRLPLFSQLIQQHRNFHLEAGKVAELINQGQSAMAQQQLSHEAPLIRTGNALTQIIRQIRQQVQDEAVLPKRGTLALPQGADADWRDHH